MTSKTKILRTRESSFINRNCFNNDKSYCKIDIMVTDKEYENGKQYYYIDYHFHFNSDDTSCHPFYKEEHMLENHYDGEIIYKNKMTEEMINYLLMSNKELEPITGFTNSASYKCNIMKCLTYLWG